MIAMSNRFGWADRSILLVRLSEARILGFLVSACFGTVIRVWLTNTKEIFNLKDELPRWWADRSIPHLMQLQYCIGTIVFIMVFIIIFITVFVIVFIMVFIAVFIMVFVIVFIVVFIVVFAIVFIFAFTY